MTMFHGRSDCVPPKMLGLKRFCFFPLVLSSAAHLGDAKYQVVRTFRPCDRVAHVVKAGDFQAQTARERPQKQILQPQLSFQMTAALADI